MNIIPLQACQYRQIYRLLSEQEPWSIIAFDALLEHGLNHPEHRWFQEVNQGQVKGIIYYHDQLVHIYYPTLPRRSGIAPFLARHLPRFVIHGEPNQLNWLRDQLQQYELISSDQSAFLTQSELTPLLINRSLTVPPGLRLRLASPDDEIGLLALFAGSEAEPELDHHLLQDLLSKARVLVADYRGELIGTVMCLKESPRYALLGGLFVSPKARSQGVATLLGQRMVLAVNQRGKQVCFYYRQPALTTFYQRAAFRSIGQWQRYSFTSN